MLELPSPGVGIGIRPKVACVRCNFCGLNTHLKLGITLGWQSDFWWVSLVSVPPQARTVGLPHPVQSCCLTVLPSNWQVAKEWHRKEGFIIVNDIKKKQKTQAPESRSPLEAWELQRGITNKKKKGEKKSSKWQIQMATNAKPLATKMPPHPQRKSLSLVARLLARAKLQLKALPGEIIRKDAPQKDYWEYGKSSGKPSARPEGITSTKCGCNVTPCKCGDISCSVHSPKCSCSVTPCKCDDVSYSIHGSASPR